MAITVRLYQFSKKPNSTALPSGNGSAHDFVLRSPTSIISPVLEFEDTKGETIQKYNYAYIPSFGRYYFISNIVSEGQLWVFSLRCDVLASFRASIRDSFQYVIRSASTYNEDIIDTQYITKASSPVNTYRSYRTQPTDVVYQYNTKTGVAHTQVASDYFHNAISRGCFVLGILGNNSAGVVYYVMDADFFSQLLTDIFNMTPSNMSSVDSGIANAIYDPIQYVTYCKWFPIMPQNKGSAVTSVYVGRESKTILTGNCYKMTEGSCEYFRMGVTIPDHPDIDATNRYLNLSPYRKVNLYSGLFGDIPIDTSKIYLYDLLTMYWSVDYTHGWTSLQLVVGDFDFEPPQSSNYNKMIYNMVTNTGVDIPISALSVDWQVGMALSGLSFLDDRLSNSVIGDTYKEGSLNFNTSSLGAILSNNKRSPLELQGRYMPSNYEGYKKNGNAYILGGRQYIGGDYSHVHESNSGAIHGGQGGWFPDTSMPSAITGNESPDNTTLLGKVMNAIGSSLGQVNTRGTSATFASYGIPPMIYIWCQKQVTTDNNRFGRPVYDSKLLSTLSGYCICSNARIDSFSETMPPLDIETNKICSMLNSGVYLE